MLLQMALFIFSYGWRESHFKDILETGKALDMKKNFFKHIAGQKISKCLCMLPVWGSPGATGTVWGVETVYKSVQRKSTNQNTLFESQNLYLNYYCLSYLLIIRFVLPSIWKFCYMFEHILLIFWRLFYILDGFCILCCFPLPPELNVSGFQYIILLLKPALLFSSLILFYHPLENPAFSHVWCCPMSLYPLHPSCEDAVFRMPQEPIFSLPCLLYSDATLSFYSCDCWKTTLHLLPSLVSPLSTALCIVPANGASWRAVSDIIMIFAFLPDLLHFT